MSTMTVKPLEDVMRTEFLGIDNDSMFALRSKVPHISTTTAEPVLGQFKRAELSGIDVLIVGAGLGGMFAAIECHRQGHSVQIIESKPVVEGLGDFVGLAPSTTRQFKKYPGMGEKYQSLVYNPALFLHKYDGELIGGPFMQDVAFDKIPTPISRPRLIGMLYEYVQMLGIPVIFGKSAISYYEKSDENIAGCVTDEGEHFEGNLVIAADGVGSKSWLAVSGEDTKAKSSGFSVYRVVYPTKTALQNPMIAERFPIEDGKGDICRVWLGKNTHAIVLVAKENTTWFLTHKDAGTATETWSKNIDPAEVIAGLDKEIAWDPVILEVMKLTPPKSVVDYKILWRNPNTKWASDGGHILQLGDSAHSFLPTSANGATQAMEDGISIAACLRMGGKNNIALATRVQTTLRFERVACAQRSGFKNREKWHHTDFEAAKKCPEKLIEQVGRWINMHDPEEYVYQNWGKCVNHLVSGASFENTNTPPGYTYEPWTIDELLNASAEERETVDPGDWS